MLFCVPRLLCNTPKSIQNLRCIPIATLMKLTHPPSYDHVEFPERRRLPPLPRQPIIPGEDRARSMTKNSELIRGPDLVHNRIQYGQFAIQALEGGNMKWGHFEMLRLNINRRLDESRMFAMWRVDPPWRPVTKKSQGSRMGSRKSAIKYYATPVKARRIILELGGKMELMEAKLVLKGMAENLPFHARFIDKNIIDNELKEEKELEQKNINPFSFMKCAEKNYLGIQQHLSPYDFEYKGKYK